MYELTHYAYVVSGVAEKWIVFDGYPRVRDFSTLELAYEYIESWVDSLERKTYESFIRREFYLNEYPVYVYEGRNGDKWDASYSIATNPQQ